jgi:hypothetical protein
MDEFNGDISSLPIALKEDSLLMQIKKIFRGAFIGSLTLQDKTRAWTSQKYIP